MDNEKNQSYLELVARLESHIKSFSMKINRDKKKAYSFKLIILILTLIATLSLGIESTAIDKILLKNIAFVCTAAVTFFTGLDLFYNHKGLWIQYTKTKNKLYQIKDDLLFKVAYKGQEELTFQELEIFHNRLQVCLSECNEWWVKERQNAKA